MIDITVVALVLLLLQGCLAYLSPECSEYQCAVSANRRIDCSPRENFRDRCLQKDCCFDNSVHDEIWCFHPIPIHEGRCPHPECQVLPEDRKPCFGKNVFISETICKRFGCCYDQTASGASCFSRKVGVIGYTGFSSKLNLLTHMNCKTVDPFRRRQCGLAGVDQEQCTRFRCCWVEVALTKPQCFHPERFPAYLLF